MKCRLMPMDGPRKRSSTADRNWDLSLQNAQLYNDGDKKPKDNVAKSTTPEVLVGLINHLHSVHHDANREHEQTFKAVESPKRGVKLHGKRCAAPHEGCQLRASDSFATPLQHGVEECAAAYDPVAAHLRAEIAV